VLTQKNADFIGGQAQEASLCQLKKLLVYAPVLACSDFGQQFILETDTSGKGLGAILAQKQSDGSTRPITYASRTLQQHEKSIVQQN